MAMERAKTELRGTAEAPTGAKSEQVIHFGIPLLKLIWEVRNGKPQFRQDYWGQSTRLATPARMNGFSSSRWRCFIDQQRMRGLVDLSMDDHKSKWH
jgi:hypothetical protein